jgi:hypothetical protein
MAKGVSFVKRTRPIWVGTAIGIICMLFFLFVGSPHNWDSFNRSAVYHHQGRDGNRGGSVDYEIIPYLMPLFGFQLGLLVFLWRQARR